MAGDLDGGFIFPDFHPAFDGMFAFAKMLEMLSWVQQPLSAVAAELPPIYLATVDVRCPWDAKGRVMRILTEESRNDPGRAELIDGIKLSLSEQDWVLVLPDAAEPLFHIYAEGVSQEAATARAQDYARKIETIAG
jgi:mannose-1-phosphate guanylyltransferase/phosphomannomutase